MATATTDRRGTQAETANVARLTRTRQKIEGVGKTTRKPAPATAAKDKAIAEATAKPARRTAAKPTTAPPALRRTTTVVPTGTGRSATGDNGHGRKRAAPAPAPAPAPKAARKPGGSVQAAKANGTVSDKAALAREIVDLVASAYAKADADTQQRIANWLKLLPTGDDGNGERYWPAKFVRPSHPLWAAS